MLTKAALVLLALFLGSGTGLAQSGRPADSMAYAIGFSTYLSHIDRFGAAFDVVTDGKGYIYVSGNTRDRNFPTTEGAFQRELKGEADAFVAKFTPEGTIVFATLIGGTKREHHTGLAVDNDGYVYLVGGTHSADFPVTAGACDTSFNGEKDWGGDVYVTRDSPVWKSPCLLDLHWRKCSGDGEGNCPRSSWQRRHRGATLSRLSCHSWNHQQKRRGAGCVPREVQRRWQPPDVRFPDRRQ